MVGVRDWCFEEVGELDLEWWEDRFEEVEWMESR